MHSTYSVVIQFFKQKIVLYFISSFLKIQKQPKSVYVIFHILYYSRTWIYQILRGLQKRLIYR